MKSLVSFCTLLGIKVLSMIFYRHKTTWPPKGTIQWDRVRLIILLNHTSLFEVLYISVLPVHFLRRISKHLVVPIADKTLARPIVGRLFKILSPGSIPVSRRRDATWDQYLGAITDQSIVVIIPEGRMKRRTGYDKHGKRMTVKSGVVDILENIKEGQMVFAYSGGLHHIQAPGEGFPRLFKTLRVDIEVLEIDQYKASFGSEVGSEEWRRAVQADCQHRLENRVPEHDAS